MTILHARSEPQFTGHLRSVLVEANQTLTAHTSPRATSTCQGSTGSPNHPILWRTSATVRNTTSAR